MPFIVKTHLSPEVFADRLIEIGNKFIELHSQGHRLTPAVSHGHWLKVVLPPVVAAQIYGFSDILDGAVRVAEYLCLYTDEMLDCGMPLSDYGLTARKADLFRCWAHQNPDLWGAGPGISMFGSESYAAFGVIAASACTLEIIGYRYLGVADRVSTPAPIQFPYG